jgi:hypothetical protein
MRRAARHRGTLIKVAFDRATPTTVVGPISGLAGDTLVGIDPPQHRDPVRRGRERRDLRARSRDRRGDADIVAERRRARARRAGIGFDPTSALRLVTATRQNLRVPDVASGAAIAETAAVTVACSYASTALAYSQNQPVLGLPTTAYGFDTTTNKLVAIVPPESGHVREIGLAGATPSVVRKGAFEIAGASTAIAVEGDLSRALLEVDLATGATTRVGTIALANPRQSPIINVIGLAPLASRRFLRIVTDDGRNLFVNPQSGFTLAQSPIGLPSLEVGSAAYTNSFAGATTTQLYVIDRASASLLVMPDPSRGIAVPVGAVAIGRIRDPRGLRHRRRQQRPGVAAVQIPSQTAGSVLFQIDLTTGAAGHRNRHSIGPSLGHRPHTALSPVCWSTLSGTSDPGGHG